MNRSHRTNFRMLCCAALAALSAASATSAGAEPPPPRFAMFVHALGGAPEDVFIRWQAECAQDAAGIYSKTTSLAATLQLDAAQQSALNAYLAYACTPPTPPAFQDPAALETDARLTQIAQHMEDKSQKLRLQAEQYRKFVGGLSVAQQVLFREQVAGRPPF